MASHISVCVQFIKITKETIRSWCVNCDGVFMDSLKPVSVKNFFQIFIWHFCNNLGYIVLHCKPEAYGFDLHDAP